MTYSTGIDKVADDQNTHFASGRIVIPTRPVPKGRPRVHGGHARTPERTKTYEDLVGWYLRTVFKEPLIKDVAAELLFVGASKTADLDNLVKAVLDAANGVAFIDDRQVCELHAVKRQLQVGEKPRIEVIIRPL